MECVEYRVQSILLPVRFRSNNSVTRENLISIDFNVFIVIRSTPVLDRGHRSPSQSQIYTKLKGRKVLTVFRSPTFRIVPGRKRTSVENGVR